MHRRHTKIELNCILENNYYLGTDIRKVIQMHTIFLPRLPIRDDSELAIN